MTKLTQTAISGMRSLLSVCTQGGVKLTTDSFTPMSGYSSHRVVLSYDPTESRGRRMKPGDKPGRGDIAVFPGGQTHHYSSDDENLVSRSLGGFRTSTSWSTENPTAQNDAKLFVLVWNNLPELLRLAELGLKVEQATKEDVA